MVCTWGDTGLAKLKKVTWKEKNEWNRTVEKASFLGKFIVVVIIIIIIIIIIVIII